MCYRKTKRHKNVHCEICERISIISYITSLSFIIVLKYIAIHIQSCIYANVCNNRASCSLPSSLQIAAKILEFVARAAPLVIQYTKQYKYINLFLNFVRNSNNRLCMKGKPLQHTNLAIFHNFKKITYRTAKYHLQISLFHSKCNFNKFLVYNYKLSIIEKMVKHFGMLELTVTKNASDKIYGRKRKFSEIDRSNEADETNFIRYMNKTSNILPPSSTSLGTGCHDKNRINENDITIKLKNTSCSCKDKYLSEIARLKMKLKSRNRTILRLRQKKAQLNSKLQHLSTTLSTSTSNKNCTRFYQISVTSFVAEMSFRFSLLSFSFVSAFNLDDINMESRYIYNYTYKNKSTSATDTNVLEICFIREHHRMEEPRISLKFASSPVIIRKPTRRRYSRSLRICCRRAYSVSGAAYHDKLPIVASYLSHQVSMIMRKRMETKSKDGSEGEESEDTISKQKLARKTIMTPRLVAALDKSKWLILFLPFHDLFVRAMSPDFAFGLMMAVRGRLPSLGKYTPNQLFWISYGRFWCASEITGYSLELYAYSLQMYRVQVPLMNSEEFSKDFKCPSGSKMNPVKKCKIWN
ncbi:hypothetical protein RI129_002777 [Pyrocoelia pectoralis]|uniref:Peptidase M13 C-terminal domain-containing protein n=1 Tax=Pyrocoelia pectoralis TaxID=417401 RepID=A0AAN7ZI61_9COLE